MEEEFVSTLSFRVLQSIMVGKDSAIPLGVASCDAVPRLYLDQHGTRGRHRSPGPAPGGSLSPAIPSVPKAPQISMTGLPT